MRRLFTTIALMFALMAAFAQAPQKVSYQAVVRNSEGVLISDAEMPVIVSILQGSEDGESVYTETHNAKTNKNGLISLEIGTGESENDFSAIDWSDGPYFIMTQVMVNGNQPVSVTTELVSVPYAMYAEQAASVPGMENFAKKEDIPSIDTLASKEELSKYITQEQIYKDLGDYVTKDQMANINLDGYVKIEDIIDMATNTYVEERIAEIVIPSVEGLASEEYVNNQLADYTTTDDLETNYALKSEMESYSTKDTLLYYAKSSELSAVATSGSYNDLTDVPTIPSVEGLATETYVNEQISAIEIPNTDNLATKEDLNDYTTTDDLETNYALKSELESYSTKDTLSYYAKSSELSAVATSGSYNDLTDVPTIPSVEGLASETYVNEQISAIEIPNTDNLATKEDLNDYTTTDDLETNYALKSELPSVEGLASETYVNEQISAIEIPNTDNLATKEDLNDYTTTDDLETNYALKSELESYSTKDTLSYYAKSSELSTVATSGSYNDLTDVPTIPSVEGLASETYVNEQISAIEIPNTDNLATKEDLNDYTTTDDLEANYALKSELPSVEGLASETYVNNQLSDYTTTDELESNYALKSELTAATDDMATKTYVDSKLTGISEGAEVNVQSDWTETDEDADSYIANKPDLSVYATTASMESAIDDAIESALEDYTTSDDLETNYALKSELPTTVAELTDAEDYVTKAEYDELKASYERQLLGMCAEMNPNKVYKGAFLSKFSVSADKQVVFSQGNLQYQPSTQTWRFAEHQYDAVGGVDKKGAVGGTVYESSVKCSNQNANNSSYTGWIDLFCYGTSGWNSGATNYNPTDYSESASDYLSESLVDDYAKADWGVYNAIINGGNKAGMWRTLTGAEWKYVVMERPNANQLFAIGTINIEETPDGVSEIYGFILLPDDWTMPTGCSFTPTVLTETATNGIYSSSNGFPSNIYTEAQWADMQAAGAVFFPSSGITKVKTGVFQQTNVGPKIYASYWSSTGKWLSVDEATAGTAWQVETQGYSPATGLCVRLVRDVE